MLMVMAVLAVLAAIAIPATTRINHYAARVKSLSNLRQIGVAARLFANDHDQRLPLKPAAKNLLDPLAEPRDQWPKLFCVYLTPSDPRVFLDPTDAAAAKLPLDQVLSNVRNNTSFIYNGFDDLYPEGEPPELMPLTRIEFPTQVLLMSQKAPGKPEFYVELLLKPLSSLLGLLNPKVFDGGSHYLYVDGSVRYLKATEYDHKLWLSNKSLDLPSLPSLPVLPPVFSGPEKPPGADAPMTPPTS
jgi:prepilin-type processing-associated H-X9-DG protein